MLTSDLYLTTHHSPLTINEARLEQEALDAGLRHPNRNLDKPELDKPAYGGGH